MLGRGHSSTLRLLVPQSTAWCRFVTAVKEALPRFSMATVTCHGTRYPYSTLTMLSFRR